MTSSIFLVCSQKIHSLLFLLQALLSRSVFACKGKLYFLAKKKNDAFINFSPVNAMASCIFLQKKNTISSSIFRLSMQMQAAFSWLSKASFKGVVFACKGKLYFPAKKKRRLSKESVCFRLRISSLPKAIWPKRKYSLRHVNCWRGTNFASVHTGLWPICGMPPVCYHYWAHVIQILPWRFS